MGNKRILDYKSEIFVDAEIFVAEMDTNPKDNGVKFPPYDELNYVQKMEIEMNEMKQYLDVSIYLK